VRVQRLLSSFPTIKSGQAGVFLCTGRGQLGTIATGWNEMANAVTSAPWRLGLGDPLEE